jgi:hypothetical protein
MTDFTPKPGHKFTFGLWTAGYTGSCHFNERANRSEDFEGVKCFARLHARLPDPEKDGRATQGG